MIIVTVHYPQRELVPKILLAHKAAHKFGSSVIGRTGAIRKCGGQVLQRSYGPFRFGRKIDNGVVIEVTATPEATTENRFPGFIGQGLKIATFDEEATAFGDAKGFANRRIDVKASDMLNVLYSWGEWHNRAIKESSIEQRKVSVTGHPRFEILQDKYSALYQDQMNFLMNKYGRFILINTNITEMDWSSVAFDKRMRELKEKQLKVRREIPGGFGELEAMKKKSEARRQAFHDQVRVSSRLTQAAKDMGINDLQVVMRPKPSVIPDVLEKYAQEQGFKGIVDGRFSAVPWITSCSAVLHHGCTTAIEAALVGKPAVMFGDEEFVAQPVKDASFVASGEIEAVEWLLHAYKGQINKKELARRYDSVSLWNENIGASASDAILDDLAVRGLNGEPETQVGRIPCRSGTRLSISDTDLLPYDSSRRGVDMPIAPVEIMSSVQKLDEIFGVNTRVRKIRPEVFLLSSC